MKEAKERIIYDNYDLWKAYEADAREYLQEERNIENPTDREIWDVIYYFDEVNWEIEKEQLEKFFSEGKWILCGSLGLWDGRHAAGTIFTDFMEMLSKAATDCDYVKLYDKNGHFYLKCSHHDGTNLFEIKKLTEKGETYLENWEENWNDKRTEQYVHNQIMKRYSMLPHFAHQVYGCPKVEYEKNVA